MMLPTERKIHVPKDGWDKQCYYLVEVAYRESNPIHRAIFYTGFLDSETREPSAYSNLWGSYDSPIFYSHKEVYYMKVVRQLTFQGEMTMY